MYFVYHSSSGGSAQPFRAQATGAAATATAGGPPAVAGGQPRRLAGSADRSSRARTEPRLDHRRAVAPRPHGSDDAPRPADRTRGEREAAPRTDHDRRRAAGP